MAEFMVGRNGGKDRFMVGWNEDKSKAYKVGGRNESGQDSRGKDIGGDQDPVVGSKSNFNHEKVDYSNKNVGDRSDNMNMGGDMGGVKSEAVGPGGQIELEYSEKGDWSAAKDAMARRKEMADAAKRYYSENRNYNSPTVDIISVKK